MSSVSDEKRLYHRIKILSDAFLLSSRAMDYKSFLRSITRHFKIFTGADASVLLLNHDDNLEPVCSAGIPLSKVKDACLPRSTRLKDIMTRPVIDVRYTSFMNTPIIHNRKLIGLSAVFSITPEKFHTFEHDKYEGLLLTMLASYIAESIENANLVNTLKSLELSKSEWESVFDSLDDLISIHDLDFTILRANKAVAKKFNMDIKSIIGKKCYKIFHGTEEPWKKCPHRNSMETKKACAEEIEDPHMCGIFHITSFPYFNTAGKLIGSIQVTKDITVQKKLLGQTVQ